MSLIFQILRILSSLERTLRPCVRTSEHVSLINLLGSFRPLHRLIQILIAWSGSHSLHEVGACFWLSKNRVVIFPVYNWFVHIAHIRLGDVIELSRFGVVFVTDACLTLAVAIVLWSFGNHVERLLLSRNRWRIDWTMAVFDGVNWVVLFVDAFRVVVGDHWLRFQIGGKSIGLVRLVTRSHLVFIHILTKFPKNWFVCEF